MPYLIGIDEAGYGPNLGPLVISASAWQVSGHPLDVDLYQRLADVICATTQGAGEAVDRRLAIADSKKLYKPGSGLALLERGVLSAMALLGHQPRTWRQLWHLLAPMSGAHQQTTPWYHAYEREIPCDADLVQLDSLTDRVRRGLAAAGVGLVSLDSVSVFPQEFNRLTTQLGTKGAVLTRLTLELLGNVLAEFDDDTALVICDKHGGRNRYSAQLQTHFPDYLIEIHGESRAESVYRWGPTGQRTEIRFQANGERFLPAALASMTSKYLRELAMDAFNGFWCKRQARLRPTAGYPVDAKRFKGEITLAQRELGIEDSEIWRAR